MQKENAPTTNGNESATEQRDFTPEYPNSNTQPARLLAILLQGHKVNPLAGWKQLGIYRLSDTAFQLRGMGWPIKTGHLDVANRFAEPCHVAQYTLSQEAIEAAGAKGQRFAAFEIQMMTSRKVA